MASTLVVPDGAVVNRDEADAVVTVSLVSSLAPLVGSRAAGEEETTAAPVDEAAAQPAHKEKLARARIAQRRVSQEKPSGSHRESCSEEKQL